MVVKTAAAIGCLLVSLATRMRGDESPSAAAPLPSSIFAISPRPVLNVPVGTNQVEVLPDPALREPVPPAPTLSVAVDDDPLLELPVQQRRQLEAMVNPPASILDDWLLAAPPADPFRAISWPGPPDLDARNVIFEFGVLGALRGDPFGRFRPELLEPPETAPPSKP